MSWPGVDTERFWREGYLHLAEIFSRDEIASLRRKVLETVAARAGGGPRAGRAVASRTDLLSTPGLDGVILDDRVLHVGRRLLDAKPVYFGDSTFQLGEGLRGWHKDNRLPDRYTHSADDWRGRYPIVRFGLYLQDHARHSGGLGIRAGSHRPSAWVRRLEKVPPARLRVMAAGLYGQARHVDSRAGDLVVWNLRTTHSGNAVRLRPFPGLKVATWIENLAPAWLRVDPELERIALFFSFGADGDHLRRYVDYLGTRDYMRAAWSAAAVAPETRAAAASKDVEIRIPEVSAAAESPV